MNKINIGLDIGIASVGWVVLDDKLTILERGVRLFETVDDPKNSQLKNEVRRTSRSARRLLSRRQTRKRDFVVWLVKEDLITNIQIINKTNSEIINQFVKLYIDNNHSDVYLLRQTGLKEKLNKAEIIKVLYWYLNRRGFKYEVIDETTEKEEAKAGFDFDEEKLPIENQLNNEIKHLKRTGEINRLISHEMYKKELNQFFINNWPSLKENYFLKFFDRQRSYERGPGGANSPTPFGIFVKDENNNVIKKYDNIWDKTVGKCSLYPDQNRAPKNCLTSEIFNLLNDLNNITISGLKLEKEQKLAILETVLTFKGEKFIFKNASKKIIAKICKVKEDDIDGYRIDKNKKALFTEIKANKEIIRALKPKENTYNLNYYFDSHYSINENNIVDNIVSETLSKFKTKEERFDKIKCLNQKNDWKLNLKQIEDIASIKNNFSQNHNLSLKAMRKLIPLMIVEQQNSQMLIHNKKFFKTQITEQFHGKYLKTDWMEEKITTPTVKRALRQSIHVINALMKKYVWKNNYQIDNIVIEMARENNNQAAKENLKNIQKFAEDKRKQIQSQIEAAKAELNINHQLSGKLIDKIWLFEQQNGRDAYTGEQLSYDQLIRNDKYAEIDHIIPIIQSFDNSRSNKVLTLSINNAKKDKRTPFQYLSNEQFIKMKGYWAKWYLYDKSAQQDNNHKIFIDKKKYRFLTTKVDYSDPNNLLGFIARNLVDTRYITRELLGYLNSFFKDQKTKIKTINGKMTFFMRRMLDKAQGDDSSSLKRPEGLGDQWEKNPKTELFKKNRIWNGHHSEDAVIICYLSLKNSALNKLVEKVLSNPYQDYDLLQRRGEAIINHSEDPSLKYNTLIHQLRDELNRTMANTKFSYLVTKKQNTKLFNETLYEGHLNKDKNTIAQINKYFLYGPKGATKKQLESFFDPDHKNSNNVLMKQHDPKTYNELVKIFNKYSSKAKPFDECVNEEGPIIINSRNIKSIRVVKSEKKVSEIILAPHNSGKNKQSFFDSMDWVRIEIYKKNNKYTVIPINATNVVFKNNQIIYKKEYYEKLKSNGLNINNLYKVIYKNQILQDLEGNLWRIVGQQHTSNRLEIKPIYRQKIKTDSKQIYASINSFLKNWWFVNLDILGNVFIEKKI